MRALLEKGLAELGVTPPPGAVDQLAAYGQLLLEKNQVMNLTAIRDPEGVAQLHMLDCAALVSFRELAGKRLLDVGTGAGFPGMVLKILEPSLEVTLLDSQKKKLDWLGEVRDTLGLTGIRLVNARAEEAAHEEAYRERFDVVTSRAVADLRILVELCMGFVRPDGYFWAMKSVNAVEELRYARKALEMFQGAAEEPWDYRIPGTDVVHRVIPIRKRYGLIYTLPRSFAQIKKHPF